MRFSFSTGLIELLSISAGIYAFLAPTQPGPDSAHCFTTWKNGGGGVVVGCGTATCSGTLPPNCYTGSVVSGAGTSIFCACCNGPYPGTDCVTPLAIECYGVVFIPTDPHDPVTGECTIESCTETCNVTNRGSNFVAVCTCNVNP